MFGPHSQIALFPADDPLVPQPAREADISVRESGRAKRLSIKVYPGGKVEVVVPWRTRPDDVASFVQENREWIARARESFAGDHAPQDFELPGRIDFAATAETHVVRYQARANARGVRYRAADGLLTLAGRISDDAACRKAIRRWLAVAAKERLAPRLSSLSELTGMSYRKLQIRAQKTCWGSHSSSGTISLNLCLLFVPPRLLRYLLIHELCHSRHMNHSRRFWQLVGRFEPDYRRLDRELGECWRSVPPWLNIYQ